MIVCFRPNHKIVSYVGFAIRAGKAVFGMDRAMECNKRIDVLLADGTLAPHAQKRVMQLAKSKDIPLLWVCDLPGLCARANCKVLAILQEELAKAIVEESHQIGDN